MVTRETLEALSTDELVELHNIYCEHKTYPDDRIYSMDEFNDEVSTRVPLWLALRIHFGNFNPMDDWYMWDGNGNLESFANNKYSLESALFSMSEYLEDIEENPEDYEFILGEGVNE